ncbi:hypothetical protein [Streptomyces specialis]|uniref:hypothetical protein n=1 Tax=Streptomyces specialis TaxID=498367 RepID=UPI00073E3943|nr:hypothetical protein [Streptomyces specialis]
MADGMRPGSGPPVPVEELRRRYLVQRHSAALIGRDLGVNEQKVTAWLRAAGVRIRGRQEANRLSGFNRHSRMWL